MVPQRSVRFNLTTSHRGCKNQGNPTPGDVAKRLPSKANMIAQSVSFGTGLSTTSRHTLGCQNQGNPTPRDFARSAPNKVRSFQANKSCKICVAMTLLMVFTTPVLGAAEKASDLEELLMDGDTEEITKDTFLGFLDGGDSARRKDQLVTQIFVWLGQTLAYKERIKTFGLQTCMDWMKMDNETIAKGAFSYYELVEYSLAEQAHREHQLKLATMAMAKKVGFSALEHGAGMIGGKRKLGEKRLLRDEFSEEMKEFIKPPPRPHTVLAKLSNDAKRTLRSLSSMNLFEDESDEDGAAAARTPTSSGDDWSPHGRKIKQTQRSSHEE